MQRRFVEFLRTPSAGNKLAVETKVEVDGEIEEGRLIDAGSNLSYEIVNHIPRFLTNRVPIPQVLVNSGIAIAGPNWIATTEPG
jgi:uncharacterized protein YbaR (Trm112 family)